MREKLNEFDRFSGLEREKRKPSFLTILLVALFLILVCSLGYDNIVKPYFTKRQQQTEKKIEISAKESDQKATSEPEIIASDEVDAVVEEVVEESVQRKDKSSAEKADETTLDPIQPEVEPESKPAENVGTIQSEQPQKNVASAPNKSEDYNNLSTSEILERKTHARVVEQARRAGVSTEGTTSEILERQTHARVVEQARRAGVSTEGSTSEILERITHARVVEQARRAGVSTEGTTSEILERITRKRLEKMGY